MSPKAAKRKQLNIKLVKSGISCPEKQRAVIRGLGFRRLNQVVTHPDTPAMRGMIFKILHLVEVVE